MITSLHPYTDSCFLSSRVIEKDDLTEIATCSTYSLLSAWMISCLACSIIILIVGCLAFLGKVSCRALNATALFTGILSTNLVSLLTGTLGFAGVMSTKAVAITAIIMGVIGVVSVPALSSFSSSSGIL